MTITLYLTFGAEFAVLLGLPALGGAARHALAAEGVALLHLHTVGGQAAGAQSQSLNTRGLNKCPEKVATRAC